jgi:hypothetical protein
MLVGFSFDGRARGAVEEGCGDQETDEEQDWRDAQERGGGKGAEIGEQVKSRTTERRVRRRTQELTPSPPALKRTGFIEFRFWNVKCRKGSNIYIKQIPVYFCR